MKNLIKLSSSSSPHRHSCSSYSFNQIHFPHHFNRFRFQFPHYFNRFRFQTQTHPITVFVFVRVRFEFKWVGVRSRALATQMEEIFHFQFVGVMQLWSFGYLTLMRTLRENSGNVGIRTRMCKVANFSYGMMNWTSFFARNGYSQKKIDNGSQKKIDNGCNGCEMTT